MNSKTIAFLKLLHSKLERVVLDEKSKHMSDEIDPISKQIETPELVRDCILEATAIIYLEFRGTTDDCCFSPFCDDVSTSRDTAFAKIRSRVEGTRLAEAILG